MCFFFPRAHARARACLARSHWPLCENQRAHNGVRPGGATNGEEIELAWERVQVFLLIEFVQTDKNRVQTIVDRLSARSFIRHHGGAEVQGRVGRHGEECMPKRRVRALERTRGPHPTGQASLGHRGAWRVSGGNAFEGGCCCLCVGVSAFALNSTVSDDGTQRSMMGLCVECPVCAFWPIVFLLARGATVPPPFVYIVFRLLLVCVFPVHIENRAVRVTTEKLRKCKQDFEKNPATVLHAMSSVYPAAPLPPRCWLGVGFF